MVIGKLEKMKKIAYFLTLTLLGSWVFTACNKYEDGPAFSLRTRTARVANIWVIDRAYQNGEEVTDSYEQYELALQKDGDAELAAIYQWGNFYFEGTTTGRWTFENKQENLRLDFEDDRADETYTILRLAEEELWLYDANDDLELRLRPR